MSVNAVQTFGKKKVSIDIHHLSCLPLVFTVTLLFFTDRYRRRSRA
jgi:hypothetical protein